MELTRGWQLRYVLLITSTLLVNGGCFAQPSSSDCKLSSYELSPSRKPCLENLEILVPLPTEDNKAEDAWEEFMGIFFFSLQLFWPLDKTRLVVVTPSNSPTPARDTLVSRVDSAAKSASLAGARVAFHVAPRGQEGEDGWDRQQRFMFWAENFTDAEFVGFFDSDTVFTGVVQEQDLFDEARRPVLIVIYGYPNVHYRHASNVTNFALGMLEPFRHMDQFPVIIKTEHLREIREHIVSHVGWGDFDEAFTRVREASDHAFYSQFNIMVTYLWYKRRDEYVWRIQGFEVPWDGEAPPGHVPNNPSQVGKLQPYMFPWPRIAAHWNWEGIKVARNPARWLRPNDYYFHLMRDGVCYSLPLGLPSDKVFPMCIGLNLSDIYVWQWDFERHDWTWHPCVPAATGLRRGRMVERSWPEELMTRLRDYEAAHPGIGPLALGTAPNRLDVRINRSGMMGPGRFGSRPHLRQVADLNALRQGALKKFAGDVGFHRGVGGRDGSKAHAPWNLVRGTKGN
eukprot:jgi/Mesvir1/27683/Mv07402-RA.1